MATDETLRREVKKKTWVAHNVISSAGPSLTVDASVSVTLAFVEEERTRVYEEMTRLADSCEHKLNQSVAGWRLLAKKLRKGERPAIVHPAAPPEPTRDCKTYHRENMRRYRRARSR